MGVPKFYRWLSERYPCLSQVVRDHQIPEFDNLYLDMNGIIHPCSHPNDDDPHFRITEDKIFSNIFHYIEVLFRIIKPQKVFFMAVDGVAPRAKMNQQRARRFRSAREAEENIRKALRKGEVLPTEERFDSNCITPGTEFMVRLHEQLKYFVNKKITTDPGWKGIKIYLSGHETPGEGEHKIMDFIRYERSQSDYDPNTRHCLYGLDADLIMLGLTSHDPHFSLLREEVRFGRNVKRVNNPEDITFHLLHLSLLREYIDLEFQSLEEKISFGYDLEKIIDDWILMGFLVGNDFIPNLPNLHINHDALPYLWKVYKDVMPGLDGYLHDGGFLSLPRFETYLKALSKFDLEKFEDAYTDMKWLEGKLGTPAEKNPLQILFDDSAVESSSEESDKMSLGSPKKDSKLRDYLEEKGVLKEAEAEDDGDFTAEHQKYKQRYYVEKFELTESDSAKDLVDDLCFKYVEAIQWILHYYFNGVPSWGWYYPYHYAPYVSDIQDFQDRPFSFDIGKPFLPFEQLLAVLPAASKKLLPEQFQNLMIMEQSPIIDYYPLEFKTDLNGKRQDWEAVVLIPFINEERLLQAMEPLYPRLKECERKRNRHSPCSLYTYDKDKSEFYSSSLPGIFPDLECCHARLEVIPIDKYRLSSDEIIKGLLPGVKLDIYFPGFPTLKHIPHSGELKNVRVKVFKMHSRDKSMVLKIDESDEPDIKEIADSMLSKPCFVGWPHLVEAFVTSVSDGSKKFLIAKDSPEKTQEVILSASDVSAWKKQSSCEKQFYLEKKAVDVGMIHVLVEACPIHGKKYICGPKGTVQLEKQWSDWAVTFPLQVTVKNVDAFDETDAGPVCATITDLFPVDTECFMMAIPHYGSSGKVIEVDAKQNRIRVQLTVVPEPDLLSIILNQNDYADVYMPAHVMAKRLGLPFHVLAQITGKVFVTKGDGEGSSKVDIGLNLKYSKQDKEVLGYARRFGGNWNYSPKTERAVSMYQEKYPEVFEALSGSTQFEVLKVSDVFPHAEESEILKEVESWLKTLPSHNQPAVQCGSSTLDEPVVKQIEKAVENLKGEKQNKKNVKVRVKPTVLYRPMKHMGQVAPDPTADFELFDRVVNVRTLGVAPYGLKGTIVGIHQGKSEHDEKTEKKYEVLFDEPFMGGQSLRGLFENKLFVVKAWSLLNLTYGKRLESKKKGISSPLERPRDSGRHLDGAPAGYQPNFRGGSYYKTSEFNAWRSPLNLTSPDGVTPAKQSPNHRFQTPRQEFPSPRERYQTPGHSFSSPRDRFSSPRDLFSRPRDPLSSPEERFPHNGSSSPRTNSSSHHRPQFLQQRESTRQETSFRPRLLLKPQTSPHAANRQYSSLESPDSRNTNDSSAALSAKESERMIRQLLHMDEPSGPSPNMTSPQTIFSNSGPGLPVPPMSPTSPGSVSAPSATLVLVCQQNGLPLPTFAHRRIHQSVVTTVCVAGKLFSGAPCSNIVESTESAALTALANSAVYPNMVNGALPSFPDLSAFASPTSFPNPGFLTPVFAPSSFTPPFRTPPSFPSDFPGTQSPVAASQKDSKLPEKTDKRIPRENSPKTPPVTSNVDKNADSSSETSTGNEPKLDSVGAQRKEIFIPHQVALNSRDAPSMEKITKEKTEPIKKTSPTDAKQSLPTTSNLETTPKVSKGKPGKAKPKLLAPSFFATTAPKN